MRSKHILIVLSVVAALAAGAVVVSAGNPNTPPGPPETTSSYTLEHIYGRLSTGAAGTQIIFTEPISGPTVGTGHTLDEIMAVAPQVDDTNGASASQVVAGTTYWGLQSGVWGLQTGTAPAGSNVTGGDGQLTFAIPDGFYTGSKTATAQDADLTAGNIRSGVTLFGVAGDTNVVNTASGNAAAGDILSGQVAWVDGLELTGTAANADPPCFDNTNRYVDCSNGTVNDTVTNLIWLENANCYGSLDYAAANNAAAGLEDGECGLTDGSSPGDWRLPTREEWEATVERAIALGCTDANAPTLTDTPGTACYSAGLQPFTDVQSYNYWSSTTRASDTSDAWCMHLYNGGVYAYRRTNPGYVWPVRDGQ